MIQNYLLCVKTLVKPHLLGPLSSMTMVPISMMMVTSMTHMPNMPHMAWRIMKPMIMIFEMTHGAMSYRMGPLKKGSSPTWMIEAATHLYILA